MDKYVLVKEIGRGNYGVVWEGKNKETGQKVAIKILNPVSSSTKEKILEEIRALKKISTPSCSPSVVCYYDSFEKDDQIYVVMEYIEGKNMKGFMDELKKRGEPEEKICKHLIAIVKDICGGLDYLNSKDIIHRDVKMENIMITPQFQPKLIDLGLSCFTYNLKENNYKKPVTCPVDIDEKSQIQKPCCPGAAGTPTHMAPETLLESESFYVSDIWSLGVTIYRALDKYIFRVEPKTMPTLRNNLKEGQIVALDSVDPFLNSLAADMLVRKVYKRLTPSQIIGLIDKELEKRRNGNENKNKNKNDEKQNGKKKEKNIQELLTPEDIEKKKITILNPEEEILLKKYENKYTNDKALEKSAEKGSISLVKYFLKKGGNPNWGLRGAARVGNINLINLFIKEGADVWDWGMAGAARGGNIGLVKFFLNKGAKFLDWGMGAAAEGDQKEIVTFFIDKGANFWDYALERSAKAGNMELVSFFIDKGGDVNWGLRGAAEGKNMDLIVFFISRGANIWGFGLDGAAKGGHINLIKYFIEKGANVEEGRLGATEGGHKNAIEFFERL